MASDKAFIDAGKRRETAARQRLSVLIFVDVCQPVPSAKAEVVFLSLMILAVQPHLLFCP